MTLKELEQIGEESRRMGMSAKDMFYPEDKEFSNAEEKAFAREELVYNVTEDILVALEKLEISKKELAHRLGKSRSFVTQVLSGARNMTLGTLSDICFSVGAQPRITLTIDAAQNREEFQWQNEKVGIKTDQLILQSENVIDCRNHHAWENLDQVA